MSKKKTIKPDPWAIRQLKLVAQYQFGPSFDSILVPEGITITRSKATDRIREVWFENNRLFTLRPNDGMISLGLAGAQRILAYTKPPLVRVIIQEDVGQFIADGRNVFAKHVLKVDPEIRPESEVVVVLEDDTLLAVGRAFLSAENMLAFQRGTAVKVRHGIKKQL